MSNFAKFAESARGKSARDRADAPAADVPGPCLCPACASPFVPRRERAAEFPAFTSSSAALSDGPLRVFADEVIAAAEIHNSNGA